MRVDLKFLQRGIFDDPKTSQAFVRLVRAYYKQKSKGVFTIGNHTYEFKANHLLLSQDLCLEFLGPLQALDKAGILKENQAFDTRLFSNNYRQFKFTFKRESTKSPEHPKFQEFLLAYREVMDRPKTMGDRAGKHSFNNIMAQGNISVEDVIYALKRAREEEYHFSTNPPYRYLTIEFICRLDKFNQYFHRKPRKVKTSTDIIDDFDANSIDSVIPGN